MKNNFFTILILVVVFFAGLFMGCSNSTTPITSRWSDSTIAIDGKNPDWVTATTHDKENKISYGIQNDSEYLYILFRPTRQMLRQAMMFGFTIWFDVEGGNKKRLGIKFPIGMMNYEQESFSPMEMRGEFSSGMKQQFTEMLGKFDVLYPEENDKVRFPKYLKNGIDIALNDSLEDAVFEMKIPLYKKEQQDIAIGISSFSNTIGIGVELGKFDRGKMKEQFAGRGGGEGKIPDGGIGGAGRRGGGRGGGMAQQNIMLDAWFTVQLSSGHF